MLSSTWPLPIYEVYDDRGRRIGRVVRPRDSAVVGANAGTVYLIRNVPGPRAPTHRTCDHAKR